MPEVDKEREYQRKYYAEKKEALSAKRRARYASDPSVREKARLRALARYERTKGTGERKVRKYNLPRVVPVGGTICLYHCVRKFADTVGRNVQTITQWEAKGVIPAPTMLDEQGRRWYSEGHMAAVAAAVKRYDEKGERSLGLLKRMVAEETK